MSNPDPVRNVLSRLQKVKKTANGWEACCPAHDDQHASLSIAVGDGGRVLLHCHAGCSAEAITSAIGLKLRDLHPPHDGGTAGTRQPATPKTPKGKGGASGRIVATYPYRGETGVLLFETVRYDPKDFKQRRPDGKGGWIWNLDGTPRVLYRLPELLAADKDGWVFIPEGEKDVDNVRALGLTATCNPGGAGKWALLADDSALHGRPVAIIPDRDPPDPKHPERTPPGWAHTHDVASRLHGKVADVRILDLGKVQGFTGKDVSDWLDSNDSKEPADLARALLNMAEAAPVWTPADTPRDATTPAGPSPVLVCMADVRAEPVKWLWLRRIALGKLTVIVGDPDLGKSLITLDMAARVSVGGAWPDAPDALTTPGGVVLLSAEDDPADTIRPRLDAAKADVRRIILLRSIQDIDSKGNWKQRAFNLAQDLESLESAIATAENCRLVIVDPISAYLGRTDSHKNAEVRAVLAPLGELAARRGVAVVAVTHLRKGEGVAMYRAMGSLAFVAAARAVFAVTRDPEDESGTRRFFLPVKNNLSRDRGGLAYCLLATDGEIPHVAWENEPVKVKVDDVLSGPVKKPGPAPEGRNEAAEWLRAELANGPRPSQELFAEARKEGISKGTLRRAKFALRVRAKKTRFDGHWTWELPKDHPEEPQPESGTNNLSILEEPEHLGKNSNESAGSPASEKPPEDEECQERQDNGGAA